MFGIGPGEFIIICVVLIIAVGPERLPQFMKTVGGTLRTLRQASRDIRTSVGIDEMMRPDPPPRPKPRTPPAQTLPRASAAPSTGAGEADSVLTTVHQAATAAPAPATPAPAAAAPAPAAPATPNQLLSPGETITSSDVTALFKAAHRPPPAPAPAAAASPFSAPAPGGAPPAAPPAPSGPAAPASGSGEPSAQTPGAPPPTGER